MATYPDTWTDDGKVWAYYNVTDTSNPTTLIYGNYGLATITAMEVDGTTVTLATSYTFSTTGEHLVKFTLADSTVFGDTAAGIFRACNNLRRLYMPDTVTTVNRLAFYQNSGVTFVRLSPNITTLGEQAFYQTSSLSIEVYLPNLESITGGGCFQGSGVTKISNLGKITSLPNSTIRSTPITDLVLPATLTELVDASIYGNSSLKRVICYASAPPTRNSNVFNGSTLDSIKVMPSSVNTYKASSYWSSFSSKIYPLWEESPLSINHLSLGDFRRRIMMGISLPSSSIVVPSGYTQCDWIAPEVGAMPYIRLGEIKNQQVRAFEVGVTMTGQASADDWQVILGGCTNFSYSFSIWINNSWGTLGGGTAESPNDRYYYYTIGERLIIKAENDLLYVNGNSVGTYRLSVPDPYWQYVCLFSRWTNGSPSHQYFAGRIHYAKFYDTNGDLLWDGVACRRDSDNKYGFYDSVSQSFFGKEGGNGEFTGQLL